MAHFWTVQSVLPRFRQRRYGHIVTVASTMGLVAVKDMSDYCASKYATIGFHESLRQELNHLYVFMVVVSTVSELLSLCVSPLLLPPPTTPPGHSRT